LLFEQSAVSQESALLFCLPSYTNKPRALPRQNWKSPEQAACINILRTKGTATMRGFKLQTVFVWGFLLAATILAYSQKQQPQFGARSAQENPKLEQHIIKEARHELLLLPYYSVFDNLAFKVQGDQVTLLGQVTRPTLKSDAEAAVKGIEGVSHVDNQIEVLPPSPTDDRLRLALYRAIYSAPQLQRYSIVSVPPIHIIVKMGHVTLEGVVDSESDKNVAGLQANSVPGIFSVTNNLRVEK
jgi:hyperosmotically inducible protein